MERQRKEKGIMPGTKRAWKGIGAFRARQKVGRRQRAECRVQGRAQRAQG
jgi:hypothetical protein